jgi:5-methylcytosine-specific restriction endonuclease McrA
MGFGRVLKERVAQEVGLVCQECGRQFSRIGQLQAHHINFARHGGRNVRENMELVCPECHKRIHNVYPCEAEKKRRRR